MPIEDPDLKNYLEWLQREHDDELDFVILYGSRARGSHKPHSDYDLLIGLKGPSMRPFGDRVLEFSRCETCMMEAKPYTPEELEDHWFHYGRMLLDPLHEGVVLVDRGGWARYQQRFHQVIQQGILERDGPMWIWHKDREPADSPRLIEDRRLRALGW